MITTIGNVGEGIWNSMRADNAANKMHRLTSSVESFFNLHLFVRDLQFCFIDCYTETLSNQLSCSLCGLPRHQATLILRLGTQTSRTGHRLGQ